MWRIIRTKLYLVSNHNVYHANMRVSWLNGKYYPIFIVMFDLQNVDFVGIIRFVLEN